MNPVSPTPNPRKSKPWTERQAAARKDLAERFARDVLEDDERADEIAAESPEDYAASRHKEIKPQRRSNMRKATNPRRKSGNGNSIRTNRFRLNQASGDPRLVSDLLDDVSSLKAQNQKLQDQLDDAQDKLGDIDDIVTCTDPDCTAEDHLSEVQAVIDGNGGGKGDRDDDSD